jgi:hypothetical protein
MPSPAVTHVFSNGTAADATQVNTNFSDLINGMTDGTKDFSINVLTLAGTFTANGNCTFGNASSDDITFTGSLASSIPIKTTNTPSIGSATLGLNTVYFGNGTNSNTAGLKAGVTTSSYTVTLPVAAPSVTGMTLVSTTAGVLSFRYPEKTTSQTTAYTGTGDETVILCDATSAAFTVTLPAAASYTGKHYYIKKTDSTLNLVTIDGNASETIDGAATTTLATQYEAIKILSDGSNWHTVARVIPSTWTDYTPTVANLGAAGSASGYPKGKWKRVGDSMHVRIAWVSNSAAGSGATAVTWTLPTNTAVDAAKMNSGAFPASDDYVGTVSHFGFSVASQFGNVFSCRPESTTTISIYWAGTGLSVTGGSLAARVITFSLDILLPIANWKG